MGELYANTLLLTNNPQARNAIQQQTGCDSMLGMRGEVLFTSLRIVHITLVRGEILA